MNSAFRTPNSALIKVLLVDDSTIALTILGRILSNAPDIQVVGTAKNGKEGLELVEELNPDVLCVDLHMPVMDGYEFTKEVMRRFPKPILVVSVSVQEGSANIFKLLQAGAVDVFAKPRSGIESEYDKKGLELISKVRMVAGVVPIRRHKEVVGRESGVGSEGIPVPLLKTQYSQLNTVKVIAIGASTGGPQALQTILSQIPANFPMPIICVQHIGNEFANGFIEWLASLCRIKVKFAEAGESPESGTVYFPQPETHLKVDAEGRFFSTSEPLYDGHRPSITVTMRSIADYYKNEVMAILLTGMGRDGAEGMLSVSRAGGITIAQDENSSIVFGMPKAAIEIGAAKYVLSPEDIARILNEIIKSLEGGSHG
ncbi:MAG: chemotaxis-specific protein-glutamate methyltransferase CheB [Nitrospinae bacterium]|nr:chemotaxis-specific protein-glutamate methyltransferase CheB [Nitrospinota bacterium]